MATIQSFQTYKIVAQVYNNNPYSVDLINRLKMININDNFKIHHIIEGREGGLNIQRNHQ